jgi:hypothetical protein
LELGCGAWRHVKSRRGESSYGYETEEADSENAERDAEKACHEGPENKTRLSGGLTVR